MLFCPNCKREERENLRRDHPELVEKIENLIKMSDYNNWFLKCRNYWLDDYYKELMTAADPHKQSKLTDF